MKQVTELVEHSKTDQAIGVDIAEFREGQGDRPVEFIRIVWIRLYGGYRFEGLADRGQLEPVLGRLVVSPAG